MIDLGLIRSNHVSTQLLVDRLFLPDIVGFTAYLYVQHRRIGCIA